MVEKSCGVALPSFKEGDAVQGHDYGIIIWILGTGFHNSNKQSCVVLSSPGATWLARSSQDKELGS